MNPSSMDAANFTHETIIFARLINNIAMNSVAPTFGSDLGVTTASTPDRPSQQDAIIIALRQQCAEANLRIARLAKCNENLRIALAKKTIDERVAVPVRDESGGIAAPMVQSQPIRLTVVSSGKSTPDEAAPSDIIPVVGTRRLQRTKRIGDALSLEQIQQLTQALAADEAAMDTAEAEPVNATTVTTPCNSPTLVSRFVTRPAARRQLEKARGAYASTASATSTASTASHPHSPILHDTISE